MTTDVSVSEIDEPARDRGVTPCPNDAAPSPPPAGSLIVEPLTSTIGAVVSGIDVAQPLDDAVTDRLRRTLAEWKVVFFRDQPVSPGEQVRFARTFGSLTPAHPLQGGLDDDHPEVLVLDSRDYALEGLSRLESERILALLYDHVTQPEHVVRWRWSAGDVAVWDNRSTSHYAAADYRGPRVMHRVTVAGDVPVGPPASDHPGDVTSTGDQPGPASSRSAASPRSGVDIGSAS